MREILFRGKRISNGEWVYGGINKVFHPNFDCEKEDDFIHHKPNCYCICSNNKDYFVEQSSISEFTGLTDKNGTKIFEGDILSVTVNEKIKADEFFEDEVKDLIDMGIYTEAEVKEMKISTHKKIKTIWSVEHKNHFCEGIGFYLYGKDRRFHRGLSSSTLLNANAEVIGNIHDNPELLKGA